MTTLYAVAAIVAVQRIAELCLARSNTQRLLTEGAVEIDAGGYPLLVALHALWLASLVLLIPAATVPAWPLLALFAVLQLGRLWVLTSIGRRWTTRIIVMRGMSLVSSGPYRYLRHPNYAIVIAELAVLPLAFGATAMALAFSAANLILMRRRIAIEDAALAFSRDGSPGAN